jgi:hypothetical protein
VVAIGSVWTAYYGMVTKIEVLAVKVDNYAETQKKEVNKLDETIKIRDQQHKAIDSKL